VSGGEADVGVEVCGEAAQEGNGGFGPAFLDALDVVIGSARSALSSSTVQNDSGTGASSAPFAFQRPARRNRDRAAAIDIYQTASEQHRHHALTPCAALPD
jgi:hypothetical protein